MVFMKACRKIVDSVGNACHEDMVGWRGGIPRTADGRQRISDRVGTALFVMRRDSMFAFLHRPRASIHESRKEDLNRTRKSPEFRAIAIFSYISLREIVSGEIHQIQSD